MKTAWKVLLISFVLMAGNSVYALPGLQLDIAGGIYNASGAGYDSSFDKETTVAQSDVFTLYALLDTDNVKPDGQLEFYLSIALWPALNTADDLGSFTVNRTTYSATSELIYGQPYANIHNEVFATYYTEIAIRFDSTKTLTAYDVQSQSGAHSPLDPHPTASGLLEYLTFAIDVSELSSDYTIHFDLYDKQDGGIKDIAPYSHDAQSGFGGDDGTTSQGVVPEPASMILMGIGLIGLGCGIRRKMCASGKHA